jgi:hypothetical protein
MKRIEDFFPGKPRGTESFLHWILKNFVYYSFRKREWRCELEAKLDRMVSDVIAETDDGSKVWIEIETNPEEFGKKIDRFQQIYEETGWPVVLVYLREKYLDLKENCPGWRLWSQLAGLTNGAFMSEELKRALGKPGELERVLEKLGFLIPYGLSESDIEEWFGELEKSLYSECPYCNERIVRTIEDFKSWLHDHQDEPAILFLCCETCQNLKEGEFLESKKKTEHESVKQELRNFLTEMGFTLLSDYLVLAGEPIDKIISFKQVLRYHPEKALWRKFVKYDICGYYKNFENSLIVEISRTSIKKDLEKLKDAPFKWKVIIAPNEKGISKEEHGIMITDSEGFKRFIKERIRVS